MRQEKTHGNDTRQKKGFVNHAGKADSNGGAGGVGHL
jgi:hypothetical protein